MIATSWLASVTERSHTGVLPFFGPPVLVGGAVMFQDSAPRGTAIEAPPVESLPVMTTYVATGPNPNQVPPRLLEAKEQVARLESQVPRTRRDACLRLGFLAQRVAVIPLMERLKLDKDPDVRRAAARALGQIGDPVAALYLQRASVYDRAGAVREAARLALLQIDPTRSAPRLAAVQPMPPEAVQTSALAKTAP